MNIELYVLMYLMNENTSMKLFLFKSGKDKKWPRFCNPGWFCLFLNYLRIRRNSVIIII